VIAGSLGGALLFSVISVVRNWHHGRR
jgi:hypothetical protein